MRAPYDGGQATPQISGDGGYWRSLSTVANRLSATRSLSTTRGSVSAVESANNSRRGRQVLAYRQEPSPELLVEHGRGDVVDTMAQVLEFLRQLPRHPLSGHADILCLAYNGPDAVTSGGCQGTGVNYVPTISTGWYTHRSPRDECTGSGANPDAPGGTLWAVRCGM